jgi:NADH-quinone oxidoreductase subunit H
MELSFNLWITIIWIVVVLAAIMASCAYLILLERKIAAWTQDRLGPNRVGPKGFLQPIADGLKFVLKEDIFPLQVDKAFYLVAPIIALTTSLIAIAVVPFGRTTTPPQLVDYRAGSSTFGQPVWPQTSQQEKDLLAADAQYSQQTGTRPYPEALQAYNQTVQFVIAPHVDIGIIFVFAVGSLAVYALILGGWSSNNKYSFLGSLRSSAQLLSYEIPMGMAVLGVLAVTGSLNLERIIAHQHDHGWNFVFQPLACILFATAIFAECNRLPFDLSESEQELVGGYHTEYSSMKFALFFLGEYAHMITTSFLVVALFFGGWLLPFVTDTSPANAVLKLIVYAVKMGLFIVFYMVVRWTLPRFRFDQLMGLAWKVLIPLSLANVVAVLAIRTFHLPHWLMLPLSVVILIGTAYFALLMPRAPSRVALQVRR